MHDHSDHQTTEEFNGSLAGLIAGLLICLPVGVYYYFAEKEEMWVCPSCQESAQIGADKCPHCGEDL